MDEKYSDSDGDGLFEDFEYRGMEKLMTDRNDSAHSECQSD